MNTLLSRLLTLYVMALVAGMLLLTTLTVEQAAATLIETPSVGLGESLLVSAVMMGSVSLVIVIFLFRKEVFNL